MISKSDTLVLRSAALSTDKAAESWASGGNTVGGQNALWSRTIGNSDTAVGFSSR